MRNPSPFQIALIFAWVLILVPARGQAADSPQGLSDSAPVLPETPVPSGTPGNAVPPPVEPKSPPIPWTFSPPPPEGSVQSKPPLGSNPPVLTPFYGLTLPIPSNDMNPKFTRVEDKKWKISDVPSTASLEKLGEMIIKISGVLGLKADKEKNQWVLTVPMPKSPTGGKDNQPPGDKVQPAGGKEQTSPEKFTPIWMQLADDGSLVVTFSSSKVVILRPDGTSKKPDSTDPEQKDHPVQDSPKVHEPALPGIPIPTAPLGVIDANDLGFKVIQVLILDGISITELQWGDDLNKKGQG